MKRTTSLVAFLLVLVMLMSSFVACLPNNDAGTETTPAETTPAQTTPAETTTNDDTTPAETTTVDETPAETTTEDTTTTEQAPTETTTGEPAETTTEAPEETTTESTPIEPEPDEPVELDKNCNHFFATRKILVQVTTTTDGEIANVCEKCGGWQTEILPAVKSLKVLAIGNSFSDDAMEYLAIIAKAAGIEEIVLGNLYIGGCSLATHYNNANANNAVYTYRKNTGDGWVSTANTAFETALADEEWTIITMQQVSQNSGMGNTIEGSTPDFPYLSSLITTVQGKIKYNLKYATPKIYWHMTWAYAESSTHSGFANYGNDQMTMYNAITDTVRNTIAPFFAKKDAAKKITGFIPSGTTIQNMRTSYFEDAMITRDGYHLSYTTGRFAAGLTWLRTLTGLSIDDLDFSDVSGMAFVEHDWEMIKESVNNAYLNPYGITQSEYKQNPEIIPEPEPLPETAVALDKNCSHFFSRRVVLTQVTTETDGKIANVCEYCGGWQEETIKATKTLKVLAIGNSFSDDAMEYLAIIAKAAGFEEIVLGNLYVGGCSMESHWYNANHNQPKYDYRKNTGDGWVTTKTTTIATALADEQWTIITMQQVSQNSGLGDTINGPTAETKYLESLMTNVYYKAKNTNGVAPQLYWHMTWAYAKNSTHSGFVNYQRDQLTMYNAIVDTVEETIAPFCNQKSGNRKISGIIPSGTTIQNMRTSYFEDANITRDGYHLSLTTGRFAAGLTWFRTLTGQSIDDLDFSNIEGLEFVAEDWQMLVESVNNAYLNPYARTQSEYITNPNN